MRSAALLTALAALSLAVATPLPAQVAKFTEEFVDVAALASQGWAFTNNSTPGGLVSWAEDARPRAAAHRFQGNDIIFPAYSGSSTEYIATNYNAAGDGLGSDTVSDWLFTPELVLGDGATLSFWTRSAVSTEPYPDRLEVRLSTSGDSTDVGTIPTSVGVFDTVLLTINPDLVFGTYPDVWTRYEITISGQRPQATGRIAFRYWVTNSGPNGANGDYIGLDLMEFDQVVFRDGFESGDTTAWSGTAR